MPFDGCEYPQRPTLTMLAEVLRDRTQWPEGFRWNFRQADTCAMGLAARLWDYRDEEFDNGYLTLTGGMFNLTPKEVHVLFCDYGMKRVGPKKVAARLELHVRVRGEALGPRFAALASAD